MAWGDFRQSNWHWLWHCICLFLWQALIFGFGLSNDLTGNSIPQPLTVPTIHTHSGHKYVYPCHRILPGCLLGNSVVLAAEKCPLFAAFASVSSVRVSNAYGYIFDYPSVYISSYLAISPSRHLAIYVSNYLNGCGSVSIPAMEDICEWHRNFRPAISIHSRNIHIHA